MKKACLFLLLCIMTTLSLSAQKLSPVLNHMALHVRDLPKSTRFYTEVVGLEIVPEPFGEGRHTWLSVGGRLTLHLIAGATTALPREKNTHICFSVPSMPAFIQRLDSAGVAYEDVKGRPKSVTTRRDGILQIYFQDPDGYWIEINNDHPAEAR